MATQVEIIKPELTTAENFGILAGTLLWLAFRVLIVWWAAAVWFPELGLTYWQLILPVYAFRVLVAPPLNYKRKAK